MRDAKSDLQLCCSYKHNKIDFFCYHLPCYVKIFKNLCALLYATANSTKVCEEVPLPYFFRKILMLVFFVKIQGQLS